MFHNKLEFYNNVYIFMFEYFILNGKYIPQNNNQ